MKEKFTQGDWKLNKTGPHHNNPELCNIEITYSDAGECICDTVYKEADANLIAAAPEMYRCLQELRGMVSENEAKSIDRLLARARGEDA